MLVETGKIKASKHVGTAMWSLADQGTVSLGNSLMYIVLARLLPPIEYGTYALLLSAFFALQLVCSAILFYPLAVYIQPLTTAAGVRLLRASWALTFMFLLPLVALVASGLSILGRPDLIVAGTACFAAWQLHEAARRSLHVSFRFKEALLGDMIAYGGRVPALLVLAYHTSPTLPAVLWIIAGTSMAGALVQAWQLRLVP